MHWQTSRFLLDLATPRVMGIVNVTPDSFSDGGRFASPATAMAHCEQLLRDGADILDIGGESTRPGAAGISAEAELARILPVVRHALTLGVPVSVDTYTPQVMQAVLDLGADIINDVWALRWSAGSDQPTGSQVVAGHASCGVCLMHMHGEPLTMQVRTMEGDAVPQVLSFLEHSAKVLRGLGVDSTRICLDPGIGFGKSVEQNFSLLARQQELLALGYPVLAGWSRKSSLAAVAHATTVAQVGSDMGQRLVPSVTAAVLAVCHGASVVRVHDVKETVQALRVLAKVRSQAGAAQ